MSRRDIATVMSRPDIAGERSGAEDTSSTGRGARSGSLRRSDGRSISRSGDQRLRLYANAVFQRSTMRRIEYDRYGDASRLRLAAFDPPEPDDEVLVEVVAAAANPMDWKIRQWSVQAGFRMAVPPRRRPRLRRCRRTCRKGASASARRRGLRLGRHVLRRLRRLCRRLREFIARKPAGLSFSEAAALPDHRRHRPPGPGQGRHRRPVRTSSSTVSSAASAELPHSSPCCEARPSPAAAATSPTVPHERSASTPSWDSTSTRPLSRAVRPRLRHAGTATCGKRAYPS